MESAKIISLVVSILFSVLTAFLGRDRKIGYGWSLVLCLFLSPIIGLVLILLSPKRPFVEEQKNIERLYKKGIINHNERIDKTRAIDRLVLRKELDDKYNKERKYQVKKNKPLLKEIEKAKNRGILSEQEYIEKKKSIEERVDSKINKSFDINEKESIKEQQIQFYKNKYKIEYKNNIYWFNDLHFNRIEDAIKCAQKEEESDRNKKLLVKASSSRFPSSEYILISDGEKWGYADKDNKLLIDFSFNDAFPFSEDLACVEMNNAYGFINPKGEIIIPCHFQTASYFENGLAKVSLNDELFYIDKQGNKTTNR